jgi:hypothetical protein
MKNIVTILFLALLSVSLCKLKKSKCLALGGDCDLFHYCCEDMRCKDYRCAPKGTKDNQVQWAPKGFKCDWFHHCTENYECQSHRCVLNPAKLAKSLKDREAGKF